MNTFIPKNRKPKFEVTLKIIDLNNIPLICGTSYIKWHLPSSTSAEHRGRTDKALVREHKATWDYSKDLTVRLTIDKAQRLHECEIHFEILQEYHESRRGGRVQLGNVRLNLAEYADRPDTDSRERENERDGEDGGITRRYLMQDSKINSTLKIGIHMKQLDGDTNFIAPPLKSAMVFGGIAGIVSAETGEGDDMGHMPSITSKTRELSELQDIYRRTLAATWACQAGELPPDKLVEDLFAGGDGGRMHPPTAPAPRRWLDATMTAGRDGSRSSGSSDAESRRTVTPQHRPHNLSPDAARQGHGHHGHGHGHQRGGRSGNMENGSSSQGSYSSTVSGRPSIGQQTRQASKDHRSRGQSSFAPVSEFDVRDDLRSWEITAG